MSHQHFDFKSMPWEGPAPGIRFKAFITRGKKLRLAEFTEQLREKEWCLKEHFGYIMEGRMAIDFDGEVVEYGAGEGFFIEEGKRHKARIGPSEKALLVMFEKE